MFAKGIARRWRGERVTNDTPSFKIAISVAAAVFLVSAATRAVAPSTSSGPALTGHALATDAPDLGHAERLSAAVQTGNALPPHPQFTRQEEKRREGKDVGIFFRHSLVLPAQWPNTDLITVVTRMVAAVTASGQVCSGLVCRSLRRAPKKTQINVGFPKIAKAPELPKGYKMDGAASITNAPPLASIITEAVAMTRSPINMVLAVTGAQTAPASPEYTFPSKYRPLDCAIELARVDFWIHSLSGDISSSVDRVANWHRQVAMGQRINPKDPASHFFSFRLAS